MILAKRQVFWMLLRRRYSQDTGNDEAERGRHGGNPPRSKDGIELQMPMAMLRPKKGFILNTLILFLFVLCAISLYRRDYRMFRSV